MDFDSDYSTKGYSRVRLEFPNWGGCKSAIFQYSKLKFDIVLYFGLINSPTVAKIFSCKNGFLSLICIKLTKDTALKYFNTLKYLKIVKSVKTIEI